MKTVVCIFVLTSILNFEGTNAADPMLEMKFLDPDMRGLFQKDSPESDPKSLYGIWDFDKTLTSGAGVSQTTTPNSKQEPQTDQGFLNEFSGFGFITDPAMIEALKQKGPISISKKESSGNDARSSSNYATSSSQELKQTAKGLLNKTTNEESGSNKNSAKTYANVETQVIRPASDGQNRSVIKTDKQTSGSEDQSGDTYSKKEKKMVRIPNKTTTTTTTTTEPPKILARSLASDKDLNFYLGFTSVADKKSGSPSNQTEKDEKVSDGELLNLNWSLSDIDKLKGPTGSNQRQSTKIEDKVDKELNPFFVSPPENPTNSQTPSTGL